MEAESIFISMGKIEEHGNIHSYCGSLGQNKEKIVVTAHIVAGTLINDTGWTNHRAGIRHGPIREQKSEILIRFPAPQICTM